MIPATTATPEVALMAPLVAAVSKRARECHSELPVVLDGQTVSADLVAVTDRGYEVFEGKLSLCDDVIRQAKRWRPYAHYAWVVVPEPQHRSQQHKMRREILEKLRIGLIYMTTAGEISKQIKVQTSAAPLTMLFRDAIENAPPPGTVAPAGSAVAPGRQRTRFPKVLQYIREHGDSSLAILRRAGVLLKRDEGRFLRAIDEGREPWFIKEGPKAMVSLVGDDGGESC